MTPLVTAARPEGCPAGMVLCGGRSRRMGRDKASLPFGAETVLQRMVRALQPVITPLIVVGSSALAPPVLPAEVEFLPDGEAFAGPLSALVSGLKHLDGRSHAVWLCGCDHPLLRPGIVSVLWQRLREESDVVALSSEGCLQPLLAVYQVRVLTRAQQLLAAGERSLMCLLDACRVEVVPAEELRDVDPQLDSLRNMNCDGDYQDMLLRAGVTR